MYLIAGLGNPGKEYENTRHNMGFKTLDILSEKTGIDINRKKFRSLIGAGEINGQKVILIKPQTFMNNSGFAVHETLDYYKIEPENLLVIYDDADIDAGSMRIRPFGSGGTHNGMKSVIMNLGTDRFPRIRIGIGKADGDMVEHVIGGIGSEKMNVFSEAWNLAADAAICYVEDGISIAMNRYNPRRHKIKENGGEDN